MNDGVLETAGLLDGLQQNGVDSRGTSDWLAYCNQAYAAGGVGGGLVGAGGALVHQGSAASAVVQGGGLGGAQTVGVAGVAGGMPGVGAGGMFGGSAEIGQMAQYHPSSQEIALIVVTK